MMKKDASYEKLIDDFENGLYKQESKKVLKAEDIVYEAWDIENSEERKKIAQKALKVSLYCFDAYLVLAEECETYNEMEEILRDVVYRKAWNYFGYKYFDENMGHFWSIIETRPYMRARYKLAEAQYALNQKNSAIDNLQEMINLNPNDNQGVRYMLINWLLNKSKLGDAEQLLKAYDENTTYWNYSYVVYYYMTGDFEKAKQALKSAIKQNKYAIEYILSKKKLPKFLPDCYSHGDEDEAIIYAMEGAKKWKRIKGLVEWAEKNI